MILELDILDTEAQIAANIRRVVEEVLNHGLTSAVQPIKNRLGPVIENSIRSTPEFESIMNGTLRAELGLINPASILTNIINRIKETILVETKTIKWHGGIISGGLELGILVNDGEYSDLQSIRGASYKSHEFEIPWLKWMLVSGYAVINNYQITYDPQLVSQTRSRSGQAIMIEGGSWTLVSSRIPPSFAGFVGNNFLSRGLNNASTDIIKIIEEEFVNKL